MGRIHFAKPMVISPTDISPTTRRDMTINHSGPHYIITLADLFIYQYITPDVVGMIVGGTFVGEIT
jgi:hypothetical protein